MDRVVLQSCFPTQFILDYDARLFLRAYLHVFCEWKPPDSIVGGVGYFIEILI